MPYPPTSHWSITTWHVTLGIPTIVYPFVNTGLNGLTYNTLVTWVKSCFLIGQSIYVTTVKTNQTEGRGVSPLATNV